MSNHQNRGRKDVPGSNPKPQAIIDARLAANLSQTEAAGLIYSTLRTWQDWEAGVARMHPAFWELWRMKVAGLKKAGSIA